MAAPIEMKKHLHTFGIVTPRRTYYVKAESEGEVQQWCQGIERARLDSKGGRTAASLDTPTDENLRTPMGHSPAQTPTGYASPSSSSAIPIPNALDSYPSHSFQPHSYATTASTSLTSASNLASSSFTSNSSSAQEYAPQISTSPQSNAAFPHQSSPGESDLQQLSSEVQRLRLPSHVDPTRSMSSGSESLAPPVGLSSSSYGGYDSTSSYDASRASQPSPSPGIVSSSEDEDGFEAYTGAQWSTPGAVDRNARRGRSDSYFQQAVQAQPPPPQLVAPSMLSPPVGGGGGGAIGGVESSQSQKQGQTGFADPNKVILAGYLMKQGKRKTWRKRWFVLMSGMLMYSRSHMVRSAGLPCSEDWKLIPLDFTHRIRKCIDRSLSRRFWTPSNMRHRQLQSGNERFPSTAPSHPLPTTTLDLSVTERRITSTASKSSRRKEPTSSVLRVRRTRSSGSQLFNASSRGNPVKELPLPRVSHLPLPPRLPNPSLHRYLHLLQLPREPSLNDNNLKTSQLRNLLPHHQLQIFLDRVMEDIEVSQRRHRMR